METGEPRRGRPEGARAAGLPGRCATPGGGRAAQALLLAGLIVASSAQARVNPRNEPLASLASMVDAAEIQGDEWPFSSLSPGLQDGLRRAVLDRDPDGAIGGLAERLDGDRDAAEVLLGTSLEVLAELFPECDEGDGPNNADSIERELLDVLVDHLGSEDAIAVAALLYSCWQDCLPAAGDRLVERLRGQPAGPAVALGIALWLEEYEPLHGRLLAVAARGAARLAVMEAMVSSVDSPVRRAALLEAALQLAGREAPERVPLLEQRLVQALLRAGLPDLAVRAFHGSSPESQRAINQGIRLPVLSGSSDASLRLGVAAALALVGDRQGARQMLSAVPAELRETVPIDPDADWKVREVVGQRRAEARLWQALTRLVARQPDGDDPFDLLAELALEDCSFGEVLPGGATALEALAQLARREAYWSLGRFFAERREGSLGADALLRDATARAETDPFDDGFPELVPRVLELLARAAVRGQTLSDATVASELEDPSSALVGRSLSRPPLARFGEGRLPNEVPIGEVAEPDLPEGLSLPADLAVVRAERRGDEAIALGLSQALDPAGEVSGGGYWVARSSDGGATWTKLYTGLRELEPYVAVARSSLPLLAEGDLRFEVQLRQVDHASLTFPPVGLRYQKEKDGLVLSIPWRELERDTDGDGLTDLVEERLATDPEIADTDGDGVADGEDPLPSVPFAPAVDAASEVLAAVLEVMQDRRLEPILPTCADGRPLCFARPTLGSRPTLFVVGQPSDWAGLAPAHRIIVLTPSELERAEAKFGSFFATHLPLVELDRRAERAIVIWSQRWKGGTVTMCRSVDGWVVETHRWWIT